MADLEGSAGAFILADQLSRVPAASRRKVAARLRPIGGLIVRAASANASWSSRIPASLTVQTRFAGRRPGVYVVARGAVAPHARPYEGITGARTFRHPVFGDREVWVAQACRPFLAPAVTAVQGQVVAAIGDAVQAALDEEVG